MFIAIAIQMNPTLNRLAVSHKWTFGTEFYCVQSYTRTNFGQIASQWNIIWLQRERRVWWDGHGQKLLSSCRTLQLLMLNFKIDMNRPAEKKRENEKCDDSYHCCQEWWHSTMFDGHWSKRLLPNSTRQLVWTKRTYYMILRKTYHAHSRFN